jgi:hypothetical protein
MMCRRLGHFGERFDQLIFGVIHVRQRIQKQILHRVHKQFLKIRLFIIGSFAVLFLLSSDRATTSRTATPKQLNGIPNTNKPHRMHSAKTAEKCLCDLQRSAGL